MRVIKTLVILSFLTVYQAVGTSQVVVQANSKITGLLEKHIAANKNNAGKMLGFCVQIASESGSGSRERAENARVQFLSRYPKYNAYVSFREPNFRVRVGDFRTRAEARGFREEIVAQFPKAFVVKDEVRYPKYIIEITE